MKAVVRRNDIARDRYILWNEFVRFLATTPSDQLDADQRPAHLAFSYDAEVQNGGHLQYFENQDRSLTDETLLALHAIGASEQASIFRRAADRWSARERHHCENAGEYVARSMEMEFRDLDEAYYSATPTIIEILERLLESQTDTFVQI